MLRWGRWAAIAALVLVVGLAAVGAIDPNHEVWIHLDPDEIEHAAFAFVMLALAAAACPRVPLWLLATPLLLAGSGLELLQQAGLVAGQYELRDIGANVLGVGAAVFALVCAEVRRSARGAGAPGEGASGVT
jgi:hypothetical protein